MCVKELEHFCHHACVCGLMIDDEHSDKSSNHPARELKAQWLLFLKSGAFSCVWVRKQMTFVCMSHQHPLAQLSVHQDVPWHKFVHVCVWPLDGHLSPATTV